MAATDEEKEAATTTATTTTFKNLGICDELVDACEKLGWTIPTPIQVESMPAALEGPVALSLHLLQFFYQ